MFPSGSAACRWPTGFAWAWAKQSSWAWWGPMVRERRAFSALFRATSPPTTGRVVFAGRVVNGLDVASRCRLGIGRTYQIPRPFEQMTVFENVLLAAQAGAGLRRRAANEHAFARPRADRFGPRRQPPGWPARPALSQAPRAGPRPGHPAPPAFARRGGRRAHRPRGGRADLDRPPGAHRPGGRGRPWRSCGSSTW